MHVKLELTYFLLLSMLCCIPSVNSQIMNYGKCPKVALMRNFDLRKFLGLWYTVEEYPFLLSAGATCQSIIFDILDGVDTVTTDLFERKYDKQKHTTVVSKFIGHGFRTLKVPGLNLLPGFEWNILYTDYENIAIVYSCFNLGIGHGKIVWILARSRFGYAHHMPKVHEILDKNDLSPLFLLENDHSHCPEVIRRRTSLTNI